MNNPELFEMNHGSKRNAVTIIFIVCMIFIFSLVPTARAEDKLNKKRHLSSAAPADYPDALKKSKEMIDKGNYGEALSLLSPFTSEPVRYPTAVSDYIVILTWEGRLDEAVSMYEKLPSSFSRPAYLSRNIAKAYYDKKNFPKAASLYRASLKKSPSDVEAQKGLVFSLVRIGKFKSASSYLERFMRNAPHALPLHSLKAYLLFWRARYEDAFNVFDTLAQRNDTDKEDVYKLREDIINSLPDVKRKEMAAALREAVQKGDEKTGMDYMLVLILNEDYKTAIRLFESSITDTNRYSDYLLSWIAWAYFKTDNTEKAKRYYRMILSERPGHARANIGIAYCLAKEGRGEEAINILDGLQSKNKSNTEIIFARAYVFEHSGKLWLAKEEYERILKISPGNATARRQRLQIMSDLGISSRALEEAQKEFPRDSVIVESIKGDMAVDRIRWKEHGSAISMVQKQMNEGENLRARYDYIVALAEKRDMKGVAQAFEKLKEEEISPPEWILENAAEAYLFLEQPYKALELYDEVLKANPSSYKSRLGKFYVLQELREWEAARKLLDEIDRDIPPVLKGDRKVWPSWAKADIALARGWFFAYEDRLKEAQEYFRDLRKRSPANTNFRTGLAYVYLWRGWPRKALKEFKISKTLDPEDISAQIGEISAENTLAFKKEAREEAYDLLKRYPEEKHVNTLVRQLKIEELWDIQTDFVIAWDDENVEDIRSRTTLSQPLSYYTGLYEYFFWEKTSDEADQEVFLRRAGLGIDHIFNSSFRLKQQLSVNSSDGKDFGSFTEIDLTPDDFWTLNLSYDSFTVDVPMRARVFDIEADKLSGAVKYRESEQRSYSLSFSRLEFSDGNKRNQGLLGFEQALYVKNNWITRLFIDLYASSNSVDNAPYFNPEKDLSISVTHMTGHTVMSMYGKSFAHRLYLSAGMYKQSGFSGKATGSAGYEHDIDFSDTHSLMYGVDVGSQAYDGESVTEYNCYLTWRLLF